jgi:hypothetical protein
LFGARTLAAVLGSWALALSLVSSPAGAADYSELEERTLSRALGPHPDREPAPEGKRIESIEIVRPAVFDDDDPVPDFVNWFHAQTREKVIRRELLFQPGEAYDSERIQETIRHLQQLPQFGVVVVAALRGSQPNRVRVVVVVRDVWSLRLNYALEARPTGINYLLLNLSEDNLLGTRARIGGLFTLQPDRYGFGALAAYPRILGSQVDALGSSGVYVNRDSGKAEGSFGSLSVRHDLISLADKWAFLVGAYWDVEQTRVYEDQTLARSAQGLPIVYATRVVRAGGEVTRSFGRRSKIDLTWGVELIARKFAATRDADTSARDFAAFVEQYSGRFLATRDVETLALQESFSLGPIAALRLYPAARGLGSSRDLVGAVSWLGYTWPLANGFARVVGNSSVEVAEVGKQQASAQAALRVVSPRLGFARLVLDTALVSTYRNYLNRKLSLGGNTRPRGYASASFRGPSAFAASLELRTFSLNILSARVAAVAFYDLGGVGDSVAETSLRQSLGAGLRVLLPQINRQVFRLDWAAPLTPGAQHYRPLPGGIYFTFGQAFDLPRVKLPEILGAETTLVDVAQ